MSKGGVGFLSRNALAHSGWMRTLANAGWPALTGLLAFVLGLLMLAAAAYFDRRAHQTVESTAQSALRTDRRAPASQPPGEAGSMLQVPFYATHLDDIDLIFNIAKNGGVTIGPVDYRTEASFSPSVAVRSVDLRVNEEYPKLKSFLSALLEAFPHMYLREIHVERSKADASKAQVTLKLAFVYAAAPVAGSQESAIGSAEQMSRLTPAGTPASRR